MSGLDPLLERLSRAAETARDAATDDDQRAATFVRGLALGALVGAAIAGSTIWQRRHARPNVAAGDGASTSDDSTKTETAPKLG